MLERYYARLPDEKKQAKFDQIRNSVKIMTDILDDVLLMGQAESGKLDFNPVLMDVKAFCKTLVDEFLQATETTTFIDFSAENANSLVAMDAKLLLLLGAGMLNP
jgi:K+-sensing histidine kinase KdpD